MKKAKLFLQCIVLLITLALLVFCQNSTNIIIKTFFYILFIAQLCYAFVIVIKNSSYISSRILSQCWWICFIISIFTISASISTITIKSRTKSIVAISIVVYGLMVCISLLLIKSKRQNRKHIPISLLTRIKENIVFLIFYVVWFVMRIPDIALMQRWDAGEYYYRLGNACMQFDFSIKSFFDNFGLCGHPNYGYSFITAIGEFLFPRKILGTVIVVLILSTVSLCFVYRLCLYMNLSHTLSALLCFVLGFSPLYAGTYAYYNPDYGMAVFFVFLIYYAYKKEYIQMAFWSCMFVMTKETSVIIYIGLIIGILLSIQSRYKNGLPKKIIVCVKSPFLGVALIPAFLYVLYTIYIGGLTRWKQNSEAESNFIWNNNGINCFGFNIDYIINKLKQIFVINFQWILVFAILLLLFLVIFSHLRHKSKIYFSYIFWGCVSSLILFIAFSCLYITGSLVRYNVIVTVFLLIVLIELLINFLQIHPLTIQKGTIIGLCTFNLLLVLQTYVTIDPLTLLLFTNIDTGSGKMIFTGDEESPYYGDGLVYNHQFTFIDRAYNEMMQCTNYNGSQIYFFPGDGAGLHLNGNGNVYTVQWDTIEKKRTMENNSNTIPIYVASVNNLTDLAQSNALPEQAIFFYLPYYGYDIDSILEEIETYYTVTKESEYTDYNGKLVYYTLELNH